MSFLINNLNLVDFFPKRNQFQNELIIYQKKGKRYLIIMNFFIFVYLI
jgi:hypothetical protein